MKTKRRILLSILSLCLMLSMIPVLPVAADTDTDTWDGTKSFDWIGESNLVDTKSADTSDETHTVGGQTKYLKTKGYANGTIFVIDSAEDLAGLAQLFNEKPDENTNSGSRDEGWFGNCLFVITKNLDLAGSTYTWSPIGNTTNKSFSSTLVGSLGKADGTGGSITISNMKVQSEKNGGLVGTHDSGGIKNITLDNTCSVTSNSTSESFGSFVGYVRGKTTATLVYENLKSAATIDGNSTKTPNSNAQKPIGGIAGNANYDGKFTIKNCEFTGTIKNGSGTVGGIIGYVQQEIDIIGCKVDATITSNYSGGTFGGIVGRITNETIDITDCTTSGQFNNNSSNGSAGGIVGYPNVGSNKTINLNITSCYSNANIASTNNSAVGGIIGYVNDSTSVNIAIKNCQTECTLIGAAKKLGYVIGQSKGPNVTFNNCVSTTSTFDCIGSDAKVAPKTGSTYYAMTVASTAVNAENIKIVGLQKHNTDSTKVRLIAEITGSAYDAAGFDIYAKKTGTDDTVTYGKVLSKDVTVCYTSFEGESSTQTATSGNYYVIIEITGLENYKSLEFAYSAYVKNGDVKTYATATPSTATVTAPASAG